MSRKSVWVHWQAHPAVQAGESSRCARNDKTNIAVIPHVTYDWKIAVVARGTGIHLKTR
jgi:hypothetical protein